MNLYAHGTVPQLATATSLALLVVLWSVGYSRGRARCAPWAAMSFGVGISALIVALLSPLEDASDRFFWAHMLQHLALVTIAAPALALSGVARTLSFSLGAAVRTSVHRSPIAARARRAVHASPSGWPIALASLHLAVLAVWHLPSMFDLAVRNPMAHVVEHLTLLASGFALWASVQAAGRRAAGAAFAALFVAAIGSGVLGALITFAPTVIYDSYRSTNGGLTALEDQQLAGLLMWVPGGVPYLAGALALVAATLRRAGRTRRAIEVVPLEVPA